MKIDPRQLLPEGGEGMTSLPLSDAAGLRQFGLHLQTLAPGASTGERHWHSAEDEFLYLLDGTATLRDEDGETDLHPGDAACFRHGEPMGHAMSNRTDLPCRWLMLGSRVEGDVCHYVETGRRQINTATDWHIEAATGARLKGGALPGHLLNLLQPWGQAFDGTPRLRVIRGGEQQVQQAVGYSHAVLGGGLGDYGYQLLSDPGGLTQFGAFLEILPPQAQSSFRHWHEAEDEMVVMLEGEIVLVEEDEVPLRAGEAAAWPAGRAVGHCLHNRSAAESRYLVIGTRRERDVIHYPDHDLVTVKDGVSRAYFHADGRAL